MINVSRETEALARRLAAAQGLSVEDTIERALEAQARIESLDRQSSSSRRMSVEQIWAFGAEIAAMPILDKRSPNEIIDEMNAL